MDLLSIDGLRVDGRRPGELRRITCELGSVSEVDGSALMSMGLTKVLATVIGPKAEKDKSQQRQSGGLPSVQCACLVAPFSGGLRRIRGKFDRRTVDLQTLVSNVVQQSIVPDVVASSRIQISINVLEADGGMEACAINAAMLAVADAGAFLQHICIHLAVVSGVFHGLIDAGIPLKEVTATCSAGNLQGTHVVDLNHFEETTKCPRLFLSWQATLGKAAVMQMYTRMDPENLSELMEMAMAGCEQVHSEMHKALTERLREMAIASGNHNDR